jgi:NAD/NADP transhydrogenase beta subunit
MVVGVALALVIVGLRARSSMKARRLRLEWLWVTPAVILAIGVTMLMEFPPREADWPWLALALVLGAALGWQRGRMMTITVDPQTHELNQSASPMAAIFLLLLVVARTGMRSALTTEAHVSAALITDGFILFAVGLLLTTRLEMFIRARRLLNEARATKLVL